MSPCSQHAQKLPTRPVSCHLCYGQRSSLCLRYTDKPLRFPLVSHLEYTHVEVVRHRSRKRILQLLFSDRRRYEPHVSACLLRTLLLVLV